MEHNPLFCPICQTIGDYNQQLDIFGKKWLTKHRKAGFNLVIKLGFGFPEGAYTYVLENPQITIQGTE